ncbi:hypothetical protein OAQ74_00045 [Gammaproteobacteria bacterium]|nr:hypothetical protein [Gammaproteobacteria bacterium]
MNHTKEARVKKALKNLEFGLDLLSKDYVPHFSEPSFEEINKSFHFIKAELEEMIERNFGKISKKDLES